MCRISRTRNLSSAHKLWNWPRACVFRVTKSAGGKYKPGLSPAMDKVLQKLFVEYGIEDG